MSETPINGNTIIVQEPLLEPAPPQPEDSPPASKPEKPLSRRKIYLIAGIAAVIFIGITVFAIYLLTLPSTDTEKIRDVFIIVLALEAFVVGVSVIVMMVQLARLLNLLQNELKPMLESTQTTVNNLRGTTEFLSENMVEPVMKLNESLAAVRNLLGTLRLFRR
ncbi:MAG TPA: hypothetical protein VJ768_02960 [Anaerolineales bacterium]|nr:hypothetical protein [Anaerolineales bacterium]